MWNDITNVVNVCKDFISSLTGSDLKPETMGVSTVQCVFVQDRMNNSAFGLNNAVRARSDHPHASDSSLYCASLSVMV